MGIAGTNKQRLVSLDVLRGMTVAGMILVNNGAGPETFAPLGHVRWNGLSLADLVFPFFLFMVGVSIYISLGKFQFRCSPQLTYKILKRTLLILLIGWGIYWFEACCWGDFLPFGHLRIPGVLHRIALSYCIVSFLSVAFRHKSFPWLAALLLVGYTVLLLLGNGYVCDETNILVRVDRSVFGVAHLYSKNSIDPEGLLGLIPSVAHTLIGFWCGKILMEKPDLKEKILQLFLMGFLLMAGGLLLSYGLPINKRIWSPTFVLVTCGLATSLLALLLYVIDAKGYKRWTPFFVSFGMNALFLYVLSDLLAIVFNRWGVTDVLYSGIHSVVTNGYWASLCYAVFFVLLNGSIGFLLYKKRLFIKI